MCGGRGEGGGEGRKIALFFLRRNTNVKKGKKTVVWSLCRVR